MGAGGKPPFGQVVVEILLILPVFLFLVFMIMEIGHLAFRTILVHHAAYEVARVGSLTSFPPGQLCGGSGPSLASPSVTRMKTVLSGILPKASLNPLPRAAATLPDPQSTCMNEDLVVSVQDPVPLIFPGTGIFLGTPQGASMRVLRATVRMPIEKPLFQ